MSWCSRLLRSPGASVAPSAPGALRPESVIQVVFPEAGVAPSVVPDRVVADYNLRYPDEVYLARGCFLSEGALVSTWAVTLRRKS